ncbi:MAG: DUF1206 domain-containing protein [Anaerolineales bacterium]
MATTQRNNRSTAQAVKVDGERAAKKAATSPLMEGLARLGYAVRGAMYFMIGSIALQSALGKASTPADQIGAIAAIGRLPSGRILLWVMLVGLASYALWGLIRAVLDPFHKGSDTKGMLARGGYLISAVSYAFFAFATYGLLRGTGSSGGGSAQIVQFVSKAMQVPAGRILVAALGIGVVLAGLYQISAGFKLDFEQRFKTYALTPDQLTTAIQMGKIGTIVRGIVIGIVGAFLILAATSADPSKARGFSGALSFLGQQPYGLWVLAIIAIGLMFLGIYSFMSAAWFRLKR